MKSNYFLIFVLATLFWNACTSTRINPKTNENTELAKPNFFEIVKEKDGYFEKINQSIPDSIVYGEGSAFIEYLEWKKFWKNRVDETGSFEPYYQSRKDQIVVASSTNNRSSGIPWRELGPVVTPSGVLNANGGTASGGGPIEFIDIFEPSPNNILAGSGAGGLFKSTNGGSSWQNAGSDTGWQDSGCTWAEYHPTNHNTIFAISNNGHNDPSYIGYSGGIMRSFDGGANWEQIGNEQNFDWWNKLKRFAISPTNNNTMFAASCAGLYKSNNALEPNASLVSWTKLSTDYIHDLDYMPNSNRLVVVSASGTSDNQCRENSAPSNYLWEIRFTDDNGITWQNINLGVNMTGLNALTVETTNANPNIIYIQLVTAGNGHLYKYNFISGISTFQSSFGRVSHGIGHGFGISDLDENKVAVACCGINNGRYKTSTDGGLTWNYTLLNKSEYHVDIEDFTFHPISDNILMANHGGIHLSSDNGNHWVDRNTDLGVTTVNAFALSDTDPNFMTAGLYHGGTIRTINSPYHPAWVPSWETISAGDGAATLIDEPYVYVTTQTTFSRSSNLGLINTFQNINPSFTDGTDQIKLFDFNQRPIFNSSDKSILYLNAERVTKGIDVVRTFDRGDNWEAISNFSLHPSIPLGYITWEIVSAPSNKDAAYANVEFIYPDPSDPTKSISKYKIFKSTNVNDPIAGSVSWTEVLHPFNKSITNMEVDFYDHEKLYITYNNNYNSNTSIVWLLEPTSTTNLDFFVDMSNLNAHDFVLEKSTDGGRYLATDRGVYYSSNQTNNRWSLYGSDLPHVLIGGQGFGIDYNASKLRIATFGRGIWEINLECPTQIDLFESGTYSSDHFKEAQNNIESTAVINSGRKITYRAGNEIHLKNGFQSSSSAEFHALIHPCKD